MAAQIEDYFKYKGAEYSLAGISQGELFAPKTYGLTPIMFNAACQRGYQATYTTHNKHLVLESLRIRTAETESGSNQPASEVLLNGVSSTLIDDGRFFDACSLYEKVNLPLDYTGGVLIAQGFIRDLYVHMGFHPAWKYTEVIELVFEKGLLKKETNKSVMMAKVRKKILDAACNEIQEPDNALSKDKVAELVDLTFDRSYKF